jgi:hypothetical protein
VTYPTAKADLEKLARTGILANLSDAPKRTFYAPAVIEIIHGETRSGS